jgi:hypothetical protein
MDSVTTNMNQGISAINMRISKKIKSKSSSMCQRNMRRNPHSD